MQAMLLIVTVGLATIFGPVFGTAGRGPPPRPFTEETTSLPGKTPTDAQALRGRWAFGHLQRDAPIEAGKQDLLVNLLLSFNENGSYELHYHARWDLPTAPAISPVPIVRNAGSLDGVDVHETGRYSLSGEILLLEPEETRFSEIQDNTVVNAQHIANENHAWLVSLDKAHLHIAGRCANYQVEPICEESRAVWYELSSQLGRRWLGLGPK